VVKLETIRRDGFKLPRAVVRGPQAYVQFGGVPCGATSLPGAVFVAAIVASTATGLSAFRLPGYRRSKRPLPLSPPAEQTPARAFVKAMGLSERKLCGKTGALRGGRDR